MSTSLPITPVRKPVAPLLAFILLVLGAVFLQNAVSSRQVLLLVVGAALPVLFVTVWLGLRRIHRQVHRADS